MSDMSIACRKLKKNATINRLKSLECCSTKKKNKYKKINKYSTVKIFPKLNRKSWKDAKMIPLNTQTHDRSLSMLGTGTSIKSGGVKPV
jgi:hypothetical protein